MRWNPEAAILRLSARTIIPPDGNGCWEWSGCRGAHGHGQILGDARAVIGTHRVAWEFFYGPIPNGLFVLHRCDNPPCCNPSHLFLGTQADNMQDMARKGRGRKKMIQGQEVTQ